MLSVLTCGLRDNPLPSSRRFLNDEKRAAWAEAAEMVQRSGTLLLTDSGQRAAAVFPRRSGMDAALDVFQAMRTLAL